MISMTATQADDDAPPPFGHGMPPGRAPAGPDGGAAAAQAILDALPAHIALLDAQGVIRSVNDRWLLFPRGGAAAQSPGHGLGVNYLDICEQAGGEAARVADGVRAVLTQAAKGYALDYRCPSQAGEGWYRVTVAPAAGGPPPGGGGAVVMHVAIGEPRRDEDALRELNFQLGQARQEADQASQAKSAFLATMSHEIRTPMNGVIGMIDVLQQTPLQEQQVEMVALMRESAFSLLGIIEDLLDFSKIEAGQTDVAYEPLNLGRMVEQGCGMLAQTAAKQGVLLSVSIDPAIPPTVLGDEGRLRQVLVNLLGNAIKFSSGRAQRGKVAVRALLVEQQAAGVTVDLAVEDNGIGMDEATLARLFTPFSQADTSTTRRFGGTGIGLAICDMLVRLMNGRISAASQPGQGSTFTVRLDFPASPPAPAPGKDAPGAARPGDAIDGEAEPGGPGPFPPAPTREEAVRQGRLILVAEDNETNRQVILRQLRLMGFAAEVCVNGREALERWRGGEFGLLLTDLHMPEMDGYELAAVIRAEEAPTRYTPIVALTANTMHGEALRCRAVEMDAHLTKPVLLSQLKSVIEACLDPAAKARAMQARAPSPALPPPVDLKVLMHFLGDDPADLDEVLKAFCQSARQSGDELAQAFGAASAKAVADAVHKLKSGARAIGGHRLGQLCADMEAAAHARRTDEMDALRPLLLAELQTVLGFLQARWADR